MRKQIFTAVLVAGLLAACGTTAGTGKMAVTCRPELAPPAVGNGSVSGVARDGVFFAMWQRSDARPNLVLEAFSLTDGRPLGTVSTMSDVSQDVEGPYRATDGSLWFTITSGPCVRTAGLAGGDPAPNSCGGIVVRFDPATQRSTIELRAPSSQLIRDAVPSPDETRLAYLAGGCDTAFFNQHLVVRDLKAGTEWSIGAAATPCHSMSAASWSMDGSRFVFAHAPSALKPSSTFVPHGTCEGPLASSLLTSHPTVQERSRPAT